MATAKLFVPPNTGYSFATENKDLERRQKIIDALQNRVLMPMEAPAPGQSGPFNVAAKISPMQGIASLLQGLLVSKQGDDLNQERTISQQHEQEQTRADLGNYFKNSSTDRNGALLEALTSQSPLVQQLAAQQLQAQAANGPGKLIQWDPGKPLVDENTRQLVTPSVPAGTVPGEIPGVSPDGLSGPGWKMISDGRGGMARLSMGGLDPYDKAAKTNMSVSLSPVIKGEGKFMEGIGDAEAKAVVGARDAKKAGQQTLVMANRLEQLIDNGVFSGPTANLATGAAALAQTLQLPGVRETLANSEEFKGIIGKEAAAALSGPGGAKLTDKDLEIYLSQYPQLMNSEVGKRSLIGAVRQAAKRNIDYAGKVETRIRQIKPEAASLFDLDPSLEEFPVEPAAPPVAPARVKKYNPATGRIE